MKGRTWAVRVASARRACSVDVGGQEGDARPSSCRGHFWAAA